MENEKKIFDNPAYIQNFNVFIKGIKDGQYMLMDCIVKSTGEHVPVICLYYRDANNTIAMVPFAQMFTGNPYDLLISPMEYNPEYNKDTDHDKETS